MLDPSRLAKLDDALSFLGDRLRREQPLGALSTYRVGGAARRFVEVADAAELRMIASALGDSIRPSDDEILVIGRGSNLLVADRGVDALVLQLSEAFAQIDVPQPDQEPPIVGAGAAVSLPVLARRTAAEGLTGMEWAVGVPGSVGGAVRMNAGGHGAQMADSLLGVRLVDLATGEDVVVDAPDLHLAYRSSAVRPTQVAVSATFQLARGDSAESEAQISEIVRWRRENQPGGQNAGSVFTNPPGDSAGRLIEAAGAKGLRLGSAAVSSKHANFIQADPGGSADDVVRLMVRVQQLVESATSVTLHPETVLVGFAESDRP